MKRKYKIFILIYFIMMTVVVFGSKDLSKVLTGLEYIACGTANKIPKPMPQLTTVAFTLLITATPLVLIVMSIVTLVKAITSGNIEDVTKAKSKLLKKVIVTIIIFLVSGLVQFVLNRVTSNDEDKASVASCLRCFLYYSDSNCPAVKYDSITATGIKYKSHSNTASGINPSNSNSSSNSNSNSTNLSSNKNIYVGDSRTVGMCGLSGSGLHNNKKCFDGVTVSQIGKGYNWFDQTAIGNMMAIVNANKDNTYNVIIWMGTNDIGSSSSSAISSAQKYATRIGKLADNELKNHHIIIIPVTVVDESKASKSGYTIKQTNINAFNDSLKNSQSIKKSNIKYCDISKEKFETSSDGLHYTEKGYANVKAAIGACIIK